MDRSEDLDEITAMCVARHPHPPDEDVAWLAVHRLLREIGARQVADLLRLTASLGRPIVADGSVGMRRGE